MVLQAKKFVFPVLLVMAFALGIGASWWMEARRATPQIEGLLWPNPRTVPNFQLTDQDGRVFNLESVRGRWTLLFFGYTFCPDVCPVTLAALAETRAQLAASGAAERLQVVFVSLDPARDTPERLGKYVRFFDPAFIGVTGSEAALAALTRPLGVSAFKGEADAEGNYTVEHTAAVMLLDPQARLVGLFRAPYRPEDLAARIRGIREFLDE